MRKFRLCGIQIETGEDPEKNKEKLFSLLKEAMKTGPDFIVFPEMFEIVAPPENAKKFSHAIPSNLTDEVSRIAKEYSVNIVGGTFFEKDGTQLYNTAVVYNRRGEICGKYRKMHLFDAFHYGESKGITQGQEPLLLELDGIRFGVAICYDIRFPEIFRHYAVRGVQVVFRPSAFFQPNHDHWQLNIRSRALDNTIFIMSCNQTGQRFVGRSMAANPWGVTIASMGIEEGYYTVDIDIELIERTRDRLPFIQNRRYDVTLRKAD
jgi:predicted amidohydrolase